MKEENSKMTSLLFFLPFSPLSVVIFQQQQQQQQLVVCRVILVINYTHKTKQKREFFGQFGQKWLLIISRLIEKGV